MSYKQLFKHKNQGLIALIVAATAITGGIAIYGISNFGKTEKSSVIEAKPIVPISPMVTALGRLEPETEIIKLSAPLALDGDRISELLVKESDNVKMGQVIAVLQSRDLLENALIQSQKRVKVAKLNYNKLRLVLNQEKLPHSKQLLRELKPNM